MIGLPGLLDADGALARPGQLACLCGADGADEGQAQASLVWRLSAGFGLSVLAQTLIVATLPIAAATIAPRASLAGWPFALTLLGATIATLPASFLMDAFGRRAAFALGASLGIAGGALLAWSILERRFPGMCLGAFWLGLAQGFGLFYRHAAALGAAARAKSAATVLAGGCLAALLAPAILQVADSHGGPLIAVWAAAAAALAHLAALPLSLSLPHAVAHLAPGARPAIAWRRVCGATATGGLAWFGMAHAMSSGPGLLAACGATAATIGGIVSLHLLAMYGPVACLAGWIERLDARALTGIGLLFVAMGTGVMLLPAAGFASAGTGLVAVGIGWALSNAGSLRLLHGNGSPPGAVLALHDAILLLAALAGAVFV